MTRVTAKWVRCAAVLALLASAAQSGRASAAEVEELGSHQKFTTPLLLAGKNYSLVGIGLHAQHASKEPTKGTALVEQLFAMGLYLDHSAAKVAFPALLGKAPTKAMMMAESRAQNFVIWGRFGKLAVLRFLRPVSKTEVAQFFRSGLADLLTDKTFPDLRHDTEAFLALFDKDLLAGQELRIYTSDSGAIEIYQDGVKKVGPGSPKLARHLWEIWLGSQGAARNLRVSLVDRLDILKK